MVRLQAVKIREDNPLNSLTPQEKPFNFLLCEKFRLTLEIKTLTVLPHYKGEGRGFIITKSDLKANSSPSVRLAHSPNKIIQCLPDYLTTKWE
jgi:hypothetical protein